VFCVCSDTFLSGFGLRIKSEHPTGPGSCDPATAEACLILPPPQRDCHASPTLMKRAMLHKLGLLPSLVLTCGIRGTTCKQGPKQASARLLSESKHTRGTGASVRHATPTCQASNRSRVGMWPSDCTSLTDALRRFAEIPPQGQSSTDGDCVNLRGWSHGNRNLFSTLLPSGFTRPSMVIYRVSP
jgi:hypothetical protein